MTAPTTPDLQELLAQIDQAFVRAEQVNETDAEVADAALKWILERERARYQVTADAKAAQNVDQLTLQKMLNWDSNDPEMLTTEKVLRRLAEGRGADAMVLIRCLQDKVKAISLEMQRRAKTPRTQHPVEELIETLVNAKPNISGKELLRKLETYAGGDVILKINDREEIEPYDSSFPNIKISGLKNRLSRIKKKVSH